MLKDGADARSSWPRCRVGSSPPHCVERGVTGKSSGDSEEEQHFFINSKVGNRTTQFDAQTHTHTAGVS